MTLIESKIEELKGFSCVQFGVSIEKIESGCRKREVSDARKCIVILSREFYPEINGAYIARFIKKERSSTRRLLKQARNLIKLDKNFSIKVESVKREIKNNIK